MIALLVASFLATSVRGTPPPIFRGAVIGHQRPLSGRSTPSGVPPSTTRLYLLHAYLSQLPTATKQIGLTLRTGRIVKADATIAIANQQSVPLYAGRSVAALGYYDPAGTFHVVNMEDTEDNAQYWQPDGPITLDYRGYHP